MLSRVAKRSDEPWKKKNKKNLKTLGNINPWRNSKISCKKDENWSKIKLKPDSVSNEMLIVFWNYEARKLGENIPFLTQSWLRNLKMLREVIRDFLFGVFLKLGKILLLSHQFIILLWWWRYANWILELGFWECNQVFRWAVNVALDL